METITSPKILCGDFNLRPETKSMARVKAGMRDLIDEFNITSTRTALYDKPERYADYIFTSPSNSR
jgi:endonuclease/exonuclease/phosphatase family metal-dependent hydrolase